MPQNNSNKNSKIRCDNLLLQIYFLDATQRCQALTYQAHQQFYLSIKHSRSQNHNIYTHTQKYDQVGDEQHAFQYIKEVTV